MVFFSLFSFYWFFIINRLLQHHHQQQAAAAAATAVTTATTNYCRSSKSSNGGRGLETQHVLKPLCFFFFFFVVLLSLSLLTIHTLLFSIITFTFTCSYFQKFSKGNEIKKATQSLSRCLKAKSHFPDAVYTTVHYGIYRPTTATYKIQGLFYRYTIGFYGTYRPTASSVYGNATGMLWASMGSIDLRLPTGIMGKDQSLLMLQKSLGSYCFKGSVGLANAITSQTWSWCMATGMDQPRGLHPKSPWKPTTLVGYLTSLMVSWSGLLYWEMTHESSQYQRTTLKLPVVTLQVICYFPTHIFCYQEISTRISWLEEKKMEIPSTY